MAGWEDIGRDGIGEYIHTSHAVDKDRGHI
jgi:hypothetical protein